MGLAYPHLAGALPRLHRLPSRGAAAFVFFFGKDDTMNQSHLMYLVVGNLVEKFMKQIQIWDDFKIN